MGPGLERSESCALARRRQHVRVHLQCELWIVVTEVLLVVEPVRARHCDERQRADQSRATGTRHRAADRDLRRALEKGATVNVYVPAVPSATPVKDVLDAERLFIGTLPSCRAVALGATSRWSRRAWCAVRCVGSPVAA